MIVKIIKIYLGLFCFCFFLWVLWVQFIFGQFLGQIYISQDLQAPSYVVRSNHRVLIYCLQLPRRFPLLYLLLFASLFSIWFPPSHKGDGGGHFFFFFFQAYLFSRAVGRKGGMLQQITLACARSASATLGLPPLTACVASLPTLLGLQVVPLGTIRGWPWVACTSQVQAAQVQALDESATWAESVSSAGHLDWKWADRLSRWLTHMTAVSLELNQGCWLQATFLSIWVL